MVSGKTFSVSHLGLFAKFSFVNSTFWDYSIFIGQ